MLKSLLLHGELWLRRMLFLMKQRGQLFGIGLLFSLAALLYFLIRSYPSPLLGEGVSDTTAAPTKEALLPSFSKHLSTEEGDIFVLLPSDRKHSVRAIIALFHGCAHDASVWQQSPMERQLIGTLLRHNFALVTWSSESSRSPGGGGMGCWQPTLGSVDTKRALSLLQENGDAMRALKKEDAAAAAAAAAVQQQSGSATTSTLNVRSSLFRQDPPPLFVLGASSGGMFASFLASRLMQNARALSLPLRGVVSYIMPFHPQFMKILGERFKRGGGGVGGGSDPSSPALPFLAVAAHMPMDNARSDAIKEQMKELELYTPAGATATAPSASSSLAALTLKEFRILPRPLCARTFAYSAPSRISYAASSAIFDCLDALGALDSISVSTKEEKEGKASPPPSSHPPLAQKEAAWGVEEERCAGLSMNSRSEAIVSSLSALFFHLFKGLDEVEGGGGEGKRLRPCAGSPPHMPPHPWSSPAWPSAEFEEGLRQRQESGGGGLSSVKKPPPPFRTSPGGGSGSRDASAYPIVRPPPHIVNHGFGDREGDVLVDFYAQDCEKRHEEIVTVCGAEGGGGLSPDLLPHNRRLAYDAVAEVLNEHYAYHEMTSVLAEPVVESLVSFLEPPDNRVF